MIELVPRAWVSSTSAAAAAATRMALAPVASMLESMAAGARSKSASYK